MLLAGPLVQYSAAQATEQASGQGPILQLSGDGFFYAETLPHPVLRSVEPIVPGGTAEGPVWVRNNSADDALLSIAALPGTVDPGLGQELMIRAATENWSGGQHRLGGSASCTDLAVGLSVPAGESVRLTVGLVFDSDAPNSSRQRSADFALRFLLRDARAGAGSGACADPRGAVVPGIGTFTPDDDVTAGAPQGALADTGATAGPWLLGGAVACAVGAFLLGLARRRGAKEVRQ
jgi:hypothetical protein